MGNHFGFGELPVGDGQYHHRRGTACLCQAGALHGARGGQVGDADHAGHAAGNARLAEAHHGFPFAVGQVGAFAGAAQRCDGVHAVGDQAVDGRAQGIQVERAVCREGSDGVADNAANYRCRHNQAPLPLLGKAYSFSQPRQSPWARKARRA
ncbi:hypothetical protein D3C71_1658670 [compost metagenome]